MNFAGGSSSRSSPRCPAPIFGFDLVRVEACDGSKSFDRADDVVSCSRWSSIGDLRDVVADLAAYWGEEFEVGDDAVQIRD